MVTDPPLLDQPAGDIANALINLIGQQRIE